MKVVRLVINKIALSQEFIPHVVTVTRILHTPASRTSQSFMDLLCMKKKFAYTESPFYLLKC